MKRKYLATVMALSMFMLAMTGCHADKPTDNLKEIDHVIKENKGGNRNIGKPAREQADSEEYTDDGSSQENTTDDNGDESQSHVEIPVADPATAASNTISDTKTKFINLPEGYEVVYEASRKVVDKEADFLGKAGFQQQDYYIWGIRNNSNKNPEGCILYVRVYDEDGNEMAQVISRDRYTYDGDDYSEDSTYSIPKVAEGDTAYFYYTYLAEWYDGYEHNKTDKPVHIDHVEVEFIPNGHMEKITCNSAVRTRLHQGMHNVVMCDMENVGGNELSEFDIFSVIMDDATGEIVDITHEARHGFSAFRESSPEFAVMDVGGKFESTDDDWVLVAGQPQDGQSIEVFVMAAEGNNWIHLN